MLLFAVGATVTSFMMAAREAVPGSLKTTKQGLAAVQGAGEVTLRITSDVTNAVPAVPPPSEFTASITGDRLDRMTSPHDAAATTPAASVAHRTSLVTRISFLLIGS